MRTSRCGAVKLIRMFEIAHCHFQRQAGHDVLVGITPKLSAAVLEAHAPSQPQRISQHQLATNSSLLVAQAPSSLFKRAARVPASSFLFPRRETWTSR